MTYPSLKKGFYLSSSTEETYELGREIGSVLLHSSRVVVALFGDLGAGKTTLVKGISTGLTKRDSTEIHSPTFNYLHSYGNGLYHFDLYRLENQEQFLSMGFDEYFFIDGYCLIEWPERILPLLPKDTLRIYLTHREEKVRGIEIV